MPCTRVGGRGGSVSIKASESIYPRLKEGHEAGYLHCGISITAAAQADTCCTSLQPILQEWETPVCDLLA